MRDELLYRLVSAHPLYGKEGRAYTKPEWNRISWRDRALFEPVNTRFSDYKLIEKNVNNQIEIYLLEND